MSSAYSWARSHSAPTVRPGSPGRRAVQTEHVGPFVVIHCDDGTTWARGDPPRNEIRAWDPAARLTLARVARFVARIDGAEDRTTLARLAHVLVGRYAADPATADLLAWVDRRHRQLDAPSCLSPVGRRDA